MSSPPRRAVTATSPNPASRPNTRFSSRETGAKSAADGSLPKNQQRNRLVARALANSTKLKSVNSAIPSGAIFSLLPPENATGNYVKIVQRVPVKIVLEPGENRDHQLRPGMNVEAKVYLR